MKRITWPAIACCVAMLLLPTSVPGAAKSTYSGPIGIATGPEGGVYNLLGSMSENLALNSGLAVTPRGTEGSWQNLLLLDTDSVRFALAQQDAVSDFLHYHSDSKICVVRPLYRDYLHVLLRSRLSLRKASQLRGLRIFPGRPESGTALTTRNLLDMQGISMDQYTRVDVDTFQTIPRRFQANKLDVATFVGGLHNRLVMGAMMSGEANLLSLDEDAVRAVVRSVSGSNVSEVNVARIPAKTYPNQSYDVLTVSVPVLLVTHCDEDSAAVDHVLRLLDSSLAILATDGSHGLLDKVPLRNFKTSLPLYDPRLTEYAGIDWFRLWVVVIALLIVALSILLVFRLRVNVYSYLRSRVARIALITALLLLAICTYGAYWYENPVNDKFSNIFESGYSITVYLLSGMENRVPFTKEGRGFCLFVLLLGPLLIAFITGLVASKLVIWRIEGSVTKQLSGHYVIVNWNRRSFEIIQQLHSPKIGKSVITVISDDPTVDLKALERQFRKGQQGSFEDVYFCPGDPSSERVLMSANVREAKAVIIMTDAQDDSGDEKSLRILFNLQRIAKTLDRQGIPGAMNVVIELRRMENYELVRDLRETFPGTLDYIAAGHMRTLVMAQSALSPGMSMVYRDLLSTTEDTCELYSVPIPKSAAGKPFRSYLRECVDESGPECVIPIGVRRRIGGQFVFRLNPMVGKQDETDVQFLTLQEGDELLVIAYDPPHSSALPK